MIRAIKAARSRYSPRSVRSDFVRLDGERGGSFAIFEILSALCGGLVPATESRVSTLLLWRRQRGRSC